MQTLQIRVLGTFALSIDDDAIAPPPMRKAQELLAQLLLAPERRMHRELAADRLCPDATADVSRKVIRQALWQIHLATDAGPGIGRLIECANDILRINDARRVWLDATVFAAVSGQLDDASEPDRFALAHTAELYRGPLMSGSDEEWWLIERARFDDLNISLLDRISSLHEQAGQLRQAVTWARRLLDLEPAHERTHRRLINLYYCLDDRTRALRQWRSCEQALAQEFGIRPSRRTAALAAMVDDDPAPAPASDREQIAAAEPAQLHELREEIVALQRSLDTISARLPQPSVD